MKKTIILCLMIIGFVSCQSDSSKVESMFKQFVEALNNGEEEKFLSMYPTIKGLGTNYIEATDAQINFNEADSTYQIVLPNDITFDVEKQTDGNFIIKDSHGFVNWNEVWLSVFQQTGALEKDMSDMRINPIINDADFLKYLVSQNPNAMQGNLVVVNCYPTLSDDEYRLEYDIRNESNRNYKWDSYSLEISLKDAAGNIIKTETERGKEVRSGNTVSYYTWSSGEYAKKVASYDIKIILKANYSTIDYLSNFANFTGEEYKNYLSTK